MSVTTMDHHSKLHWKNYEESGTLALIQQRYFTSYNATWGQSCDSSNAMVPASESFKLASSKA
jgi:hypothetical protein